MASNITLQVGQSVPVTTRIIDGYGSLSSAHVITYISSDPVIAIVAEQGSFVPNTVPLNSISTNTITGLTNGICVVTVSVDGSVQDVINVTVNSPPPAALVFIFGTPTP